MKRTICALVTAVAMSLPMAASGNDKPDLNRYVFNGMVGKEKVSFDRRGKSVYLEVNTKHGKRLTFEDEDGDLKVDKFTIRETIMTYSYDRAEFPDVMDAAQKKFDSYLPKLVEAKANFKEMKKKKALDVLVPKDPCKITDEGLTECGGKYR